MDLDPTRITFARDGYTYVCRFAPARLATRCGFRMAAVIAPVMQGIARAKKAEGLFTAAMIYLFTNPVLEESVQYLIDAFAPFTEVIVDGSNPPVSFTLGASGPHGPWIDAHFAGRQDALIDWLSRVSAQNCASFLSGLLAKQREAEKALEELRGEKASSSPNDAAKTG